MDLTGPWRATPRSPELDRDGADPDLDDSGWEIVTVPAHWGQHGEFADSLGPIIYRYHFHVDALDEVPADSPAEERRSWLTLDGVMSEADIWLDGHHLGDTSTYFARHRFEVTDQLNPGPDAPDGPETDNPETDNPDPRAAEHLLAIEVSCETTQEGAKHSLTGSLQSGPLAPPGNPGGIWRDVRIDTTGSVAILSSRLLCTHASPNRAELQFKVVLDAAQAGEIRIDTSIAGPDGSTAGGHAVHAVASGENHLEWTSVVDDPHLWWPASLGDQPRYDVTIAIRAGEDRVVSDRRHWRTGLRTISVDNLQWRINGERLFVKGVTIGPHSRFLGSVPVGRFVSDVEAVRDAGLDLIRVYGHVTCPEFYDAADELGVLIWQDLPLVGSYSTSARSSARALARAAVDELGHHPCIGLWCAHDEPNGPALQKPTGGLDPLSKIGRRLGRHILPSWNRSVLDPQLRRELRSADPSRAVIARSGNLPGIADFNDSDTHLWLGWRTGRAEDLADLLRRWPRLGLFVGAIGSQSAVVDDWDVDAPMWETAEIGSFERYLPRGAYGDGQGWAHATQAYQADVIQTQIETLRRLKYQPTGGFTVVSLFDAEPSGGFGLLDRTRRAKPALTALIDSCRPVIVVADVPPQIVTPGQTLSLAVHAVSDLRHDLGAVRVTARARLDDWVVERRWSGSLDADSVAYIATLDIKVPAKTGALVIDLELEASDRVVTNRYQTVVIPPSEAVSRSASGLRPS